ncbi:hypothetical protein FGD67_14850 [Colwellia sp. M166]|jgi:hypothetical protein|uniref:hypothetical protein n=1 Tax=Colwellia sp. M166 TaxID=2583805 RepID=UPI00211DCBDC|nr:hypothetical protein [Colwellia sp. M166]UUO24357.1 hypothetical protein FGD67_14850 [Colwellia sp. M166]|tara:strand:+ start:26068 stop:26256 length:189 start_codon:yes stop_codon:yes gene_type:complete
MMDLITKDFDINQITLLWLFMMSSFTVSLISAGKLLTGFAVTVIEVTIALKTRVFISAYKTS